MTIKPEETTIAARIAWVAPEWRTLDVSETAMNPGRRLDGNTQVDCTLS